METKRTNKKRSKVFVVLVVALILLAWKADGYQQSQYRKMELGYQYVEEGHYAEATECFAEYLKRPAIHWYWLELVNGKEFKGTYDNVQEVMRRIE